MYTGGIPEFKKRKKKNVERSIKEQQQKSSKPLYQRQKHEDFKNSIKEYIEGYETDARSKSLQEEKLNIRQRKLLSLKRALIMLPAKFTA